MKSKHKYIILFILLTICTISIGCNNNDSKEIKESDTPINMEQSFEKVESEPIISSITHDEYISLLQQSESIPMSKAIEYDKKETEDYIKNLHDKDIVSDDSVINIYEVRAYKTCSFNETLKVNVGGLFKICDIDGKKEVINVIPYTEDATNLKDLEWKESYVTLDSIYKSNASIMARGVFIYTFKVNSKKGIDLGIFNFGVTTTSPYYHVSEPFNISLTFDISRM